MFLGLDLGTTNIKAILADREGNVVARGSAPVRYVTVGQGGVEQDLEEIWQATLTAMAELAGRADVSGVEAVGVSSQGAAMQITDAAGRPVGPVISWMDGRGAVFDTAATEALGRSWFVRHTGHDRCFLSAGQLLRLRSDQPELLAPPNRVGFVGDLIVGRLCGRTAHDATSLSIAWLYNPTRDVADPELLEYVGIGEDQLPALLSARSLAGGLRKEVAERTGLPVGIPVAAAVHDQYAAALGAGAVHTGDVMFGAGTAWVLLAVGDELKPPAVDGAFVCRHVVEGRYGQMVSLVNGGSTFAWAVDLLGLTEKSHEELDAMVESAPVGSGGLHFDLTDPRAWSLSGLHLSHGAGHVLRVVVEGLVFELARRLRQLEQGGVPVRRLVMTGGAAKSRVTSQIMADVVGRSVACARKVEMSALGAAVIARGLTEPDAGLAHLSQEMAPSVVVYGPGPNANAYQQMLAGASSQE